ncbi:pseudouridine-5'-phosphate glycosidase [Aureispira anguillae]|uniref:Pseudouridine-5'-phosphate glycosidase n=1 Tax=Aureispira anguillae TaxID=2864201 RepID=A0A915YKV5_9BACT|nr:pseudouridine-5'-phosphate glycosidase [Aureispira anguillae]BDS14963.1 pseudouridine-5'-phosphate glycosidase [Aureispira anguillae]
MKKYIEISSEVQRAIQNNQPVVALESTIISHGMPFPKNMETALAVEQIVRSNGAIPATIAILNGKFKVGLTQEEVKYLGKAGQKIIKASRRDIPYLLSKKIDGATTVASTMIAAEMAGIKVFATGGIGGVHRGAETSFDVSADLQELAKTNVAVVCAGIKAILDLGLTLEYLETHGVPVIGYQTAELPAFYTQKSGFNVDYRLENATEIAHFLQTKWGMNLQGGVVIANPIPADKQLDYDYMMENIAIAIAEANRLGIKGKESTPFLLAKVKELTTGKSLASNIELVYNNAQLAAQIAVALHSISYK